METLARAVYQPLDYFGFLDDLARGSAFVKAGATMLSAYARDRASAFYMFERAAKAHPKNVMFIFEEQAWTWEDVYQESSQLAHLWKDKGLKRGDIIAMICPNKPTFVILWLAFMQIGVAPAFINYNLTGESLLHCIKVSDGKTVLFDKDVVKNVSDIKSDLDKEGLKLFEWQDGLSVADAKEGSKENGHADVGGKNQWEVITKQSYEKASKQPIDDKERKGITFKDPVCLIYTSGTSGLPKAAPCSQAKIRTAALSWAKFSQFRPDDIVFTGLPLYHSSAAFLCVAAAWTSGSTVAISRHFSASRFWKEVRASNATVIQYIGEICRYILSQPESPMDKIHRVRMAYGNGMRPDVWMPFKERFGIPTVVEFFASTEGNTFLFNYNVGYSKFGAGAIGREAFLSKTVAGNYLVKVDPDSQEIYRNAKGFCEESSYREAGELLIRIDDLVPVKQFGGYQGNKKATEEKIMEDVFRKGDKYFRTGDLLSRDLRGFYYFEDRLGDTFRWKSENVSTSEVQSVISSFDGLDSAVAVYGVAIPKHDGRAGCAGIPKAEFEKVDLGALAKHTKGKLPKYAVPVFIRVTEEQDKTSTEKIVTTHLKKEGIDPEKVKDKVYWLQGDTYVEFKKEDWEAIQSGKKKL